MLQQWQLHFLVYWVGIKSPSPLFSQQWQLHYLVYWAGIKSPSL